MPKRPRNIERDLAYGSGTVVRKLNRWVARWYEGDVRKSKSFLTKEDADDFLRARRRAKRRGQALPPVGMTVSEIIEDWLTRGAHDWKPATVATYGQRYRRHIKDRFGATRAEQLTTYQVQQWVDQLVVAELSANVIDAVVRVLSGAFNQAVELKIVPVNPTRGVKRPEIKQREMVTWSREHIRRVDAALSDDPMWRAVYRVMLGTGMRPGELRALRWSDLDLVKGSVHIQRTISKDRDGHVVVGAKTKTGLDRAVPLAIEIVGALTCWQEQCPDNEGGWVFPSKGGSFLPLTSWQHRHDQLIEQTKVPKITLHGLRHSSATLEVRAGTHITIVSQRLGHKKIETTMNFYQHPDDAIMREAATTLGLTLFGELDPSEPDPS